MPTQRKIALFIPGVILFGIAMIFTGCYTILMQPGTEAEKFAVNPSSGSTSAREINYTDDCTSCHSAAELADRSYDASRYNLRSVHGIAIDPYGWKSPTYSRPWWNPQQQPFIPTGSGAVTTTSTQPERPRPSGSTRGDDTPTRPTGSSTSNAPATITTVTPTSTPTNTSVPSTPTGTQIAPTTTPAPVPQSAPAEPNSPVERQRPSAPTRGDNR